ncbi:hypothetical protein THAOC_11065 [Thalassiosira oceanica]|uniref:Uncharacterized protein n=1 Tax=Thalassiosira oceanica TaxID=159749 RepID=K0SS74_THAOC|nr:hypothetical protein THAOC_11065 [Thalassiosira oceanica]|eukprot:EJK67839.1 hypothetical protein THAOC_11065 [Thalassiosira oceanica]
MIGKVLSVPEPGVNRIEYFVGLSIIPLNHSGEFVVDRTGATNGAHCCPGHELDGWTPTDTRTRVLEVRSPKQQQLPLMARIQLIKREAAGATDVQRQQLPLASRIQLIKREAARATDDRSSLDYPKRRTIQLRTPWFVYFLFSQVVSTSPLTVPQPLPLNSFGFALRFYLDSRQRLSRAFL